MSGRRFFFWDPVSGIINAAFFSLRPSFLSACRTRTPSPAITVASSTTICRGPGARCRPSAPSGRSAVRSASRTTGASSASPTRSNLIVFAKDGDDHGGPLCLSLVPRDNTRAKERVAFARERFPCFFFFPGQKQSAMTEVSNQSLP